MNTELYAVLTLIIAVIWQMINYCKPGKFPNAMFWLNIILCLVFAFRS